MNSAIIVAAGSGSRFGRPKQFIDIAGKPLIIHTIEKFENCPEVDEVILVLPQEEVDHFTAELARYKLEKVSSVVAGGKTRAASVFNGLQQVDKACTVVAVHDGARPLVRIDEIGMTICSAAQNGASCLVSAVTDTIKEVSEDGTIAGTVDRTRLRKALTPQCARYDLLIRAFALPDSQDESITDECMLIERLGHKVFTVEGSPDNIKITYPQDVRFAEMVLGEVADR